MRNLLPFFVIPSPYRATLTGLLSPASRAPFPFATRIAVPAGHSRLSRKHQSLPAQPRGHDATIPVPGQRQTSEPSLLHGLIRRLAEGAIPEAPILAPLDRPVNVATVSCRIERPRFRPCTSVSRRCEAMSPDPNLSAACVITQPGGPCVARPAGQGRFETLQRARWWLHAHRPDRRVHVPVGHLLGLVSSKGAPLPSLSACQGAYCGCDWPLLGHSRVFPRFLSWAHLRRALFPWLVIPKFRRPWPNGTSGPETADLRCSGTLHSAVVFRPLVQCARGPIKPHLEKEAMPGRP